MPSSSSRKTGSGSSKSTTGSSSSKSSSSKSKPPASFKRSKTTGSPTVKLTVDDALGRLQYGRFHKRLLIMASIATFANSMATMVTFFFPQSVQASETDWAMTDLQTATLTAMPFFGASIGTIFLALFSDRLGRRVAFMAYVMITAIFGFLSGVVAPSYVVLLLLRLAVGFGLGGTMGPFYAVAEWVPHQRRGHALLKLSFAWTMGTFVTPIVAWATIDQADNWKLLLIICSAPSVLSFLVAALYLPESPRWLMGKGNSDIALALMRDAAIVNHQDPWVVAPQSAHLMRGGKTKSKWKAVGRLFRKEWRRMILCLIPTFLVVDFLYYSYVQLIHMAISDTDGDEDQFAFFEIALTSLAEFFGAIFALTMIGSVGRVPTQAVGYFGGGLTILGMCVGRHFEAGTGKSAATSFLFYLAFISRFLIFSAVSVTWVHTIEILPKKVRGAFHMTAHAFASLGAAASCYHMVSMNIPFLIVGIVVGAVSIALSLLTWTFPETKGLTGGGGGFGGDEETEGMIDKSEMSRSGRSQMSNRSQGSTGGAFSRSRTR